MVKGRFNFNERHTYDHQVERLCLTGESFQQHAMAHAELARRDLMVRLGRNELVRTGHRKLADILQCVLLPMMASRKDVYQRHFYGETPLYMLSRSRMIRSSS